MRYTFELEFKETKCCRECPLQQRDAMGYPISCIATEECFTDAQETLLPNCPLIERQVFTTQQYAKLFEIILQPPSPTGRYFPQPDLLGSS